MDEHPRTGAATRASVARVLGFLMILCWEVRFASALAPGVGGPKTTLVIFSDRPLAQSTWAVLFDQLRVEAAAAARNFEALDVTPEILKGADVLPGQMMENPIVVRLHGDCRPPVGVSAFPSEAPLGWVRREEGRISPFVQVDCTRVAQVVSARLFAMDNGEKSSAMCSAIARVILHEWIHIAEQTDHHSRTGIAKRTFGSDDLVPRVDAHVGRQANGSTIQQQEPIARSMMPGDPQSEPALKAHSWQPGRAPQP